MACSRYSFKCRLGSPSCSQGCDLATTLEPYPGRRQTTFLRPAQSPHLVCLEGGNRPARWHRAFGGAPFGSTAQLWRASSRRDMPVRAVVSTSSHLLAAFTVSSFSSASPPFACLILDGPPVPTVSEHCRHISDACGIALPVRPEGCSCWPYEKHLVSSIGAPVTRDYVY